MPTELFANSATATLNMVGGLDNSTVSLTLTYTPGTGIFPNPAYGQFRIVVDSEIMLVTATPGTNQWTVTRGIETPLLVHANGAPIVQWGTAGAFNQFEQITDASAGPTVIGLSSFLPQYSPQPTVAPTFGGTTGGSLVSATTYYFTYTYVGPAGESIASAQFTASPGGTNTALTFNLPANPTFVNTFSPTVSQYNVYMGTASGGPYYKVASGQVAGAINGPYSLGTTITINSAPPSANGTSPTTALSVAMTAGQHTANGQRSFLAAQTLAIPNNAGIFYIDATATAFQVTTTANAATTAIRLAQITTNWTTGTNGTTITMIRDFRPTGESSLVPSSTLMYGGAGGDQWNGFPQYLVEAPVNKVGPMFMLGARYQGGDLQAGIRTSGAGPPDLVLGAHGWTYINLDNYGQAIGSTGVYFGNGGGAIMGSVDGSGQAAFYGILHTWGNSSTFPVILNTDRPVVVSIPTGQSWSGIAATVSAGADLNCRGHVAIANSTGSTQTIPAFTAFVTVAYHGTGFTSSLGQTWPIVAWRGLVATTVTVTGAPFVSGPNLTQFQIGCTSAITMPTGTSIIIDYMVLG